MPLPQLARFTDLSLLLLRLVVALIFGTSGWNHLKDPEGRSKSIGMSKAFTIFLGIAEFAGGLGMAAGVLAQFAAIGFILIMFGAMQKKIFEWHLTFWASNGWNYEITMIVMNLVIVTTGGGRYTLLR